MIRILHVCGLSSTQIGVMHSYMEWNGTCSVFFFLSIGEKQHVQDYRLPHHSDQHQLKFAKKIPNLESLKLFRETIASDFLFITVSFSYNCTKSKIKRAREREKWAMMLKCNERMLLKHITSTCLRYTIVPKSLTGAMKLIGISSFISIELHHFVTENCMKTFCAIGIMVFIWSSFARWHSCFFFLLFISLFCCCWIFFFFQWNS